MSRVYRIRLGEFFYYGSTKGTLNSRLIKHKYQSKKSPSVKLYQKALEIGWDNAIIELVEECTGLDSDAVLQREEAYIILTDPMCLNTKKAYITAEEKRLEKNRLSREHRLRKRLLNPLLPHLTEEEKAQHQREANARWREKNPHKVKEQNKRYWAKRKDSILTEEEREAKRAYSRNYMRIKRSK